MEKMKKLKLALVPASTLAFTPAAFAGDFSDAVNTAIASITGMKGDVVNVFTALIGIAALVWVGRKVVGLFGR